MYIYGKNPIKELIDKKSDLLLELFIDVKRHNSFYNELKKLNIEPKKLSEINYKKMFPNKNVQGIVAKITDPQILSVDQLIKNNSLREENTILLLDHISDPQNFGSIMRNAAAFGVNSIILTKYESAPLNATSIKASSGAWINLEIAQASSINHVVNELKKNNYWIISTSLTGEKNLSKIKEFKKKVIIFGSEGKGVRKSLQSRADFNIKISMTNNVESLNVSSATAIILYEIYK
ncbi:MAG: 23S rRNA (guanosine(2251)-2'-O)-methyltransferase RlmB [Mycoplasmataceae bacterium]|nr:23S rRNA (guanosine(2251)-2'-O)-methyltransferase RlmB [Mycoplasmataceae bacterium]